MIQREKTPEKTPKTPRAEARISLLVLRRLARVPQPTTRSTTVQVRRRRAVDPRPPRCWRREHGAVGANGKRRAIATGAAHRLVRQLRRCRHHSQRRSDERNDIRLHGRHEMRC